MSALLPLYPCRLKRTFIGGVGMSQTYHQRTSLRAPHKKSRRLDDTMLTLRGSPTSASMIVVELHLGHGAGCLAIDPIRALAQQVAGEQPLPFFAGDDFSRRWLPLGNYQRRALVSYADIEVELVEACLD